MALEASGPEAAVPGADALRRRVRDALGALAAEGHDLERFAAMRALAGLGGADLQPVFVAGLTDPDEDVRCEAAEALGRHGRDAAAMRALRDSLHHDPSADVKLAALRALARLRDGETVPLLRRLAVERDDDMAWDEEEFYAGGWDDWLDVQLAAIEALGDLGIVEAVPDIMAAMADEMGQDLHDVACRVLAKLVGPGTDALGALLGGEEARARTAAAKALAGLGTDRANALLRSRLNDPAPEIRVWAVRSVAAADLEDPALSERWTDPSALVRVEMYRCARPSDDQCTVALLRDKDPVVQKAIVDAVAAGTQPFDDGDRLLGVLRSKLRSGAPEIASAAAAALARRAPRHVAFADLRIGLLDGRRDESVRAACATALGGVGELEAVLALREVLTDEAHAVRRAALMALGQAARSGREGPASLAARDGLLTLLPVAELEPEEIEPEAETPDDMQLQESPEPPEVEARAGEDGEAPASTLDAILAAEAALPPPQTETRFDTEALTPEERDLLALASSAKRARRFVRTADISADRENRRLAAELLGELPGDDTVAALTLCLDAPDEGLPEAAAGALARCTQAGGSLPEAAVEALQASLTTATDPGIRRASAKALAADAGDPALAALTHALADTDASVRTVAGSGLVAAGRAQEALPLLSDPDPNTRLAIAEALLPAATPALVDAMVALIRSFPGSHHRQAARLLRKAGAERGAPTLLELLADGTDTFRPVLIECLGELFRETEATAA